MTKDEIKARGRKRRMLALPAASWGEGVFALSMSAKSRIEYEEKVAGVDDKDRAAVVGTMVDLIVRSVGTADGTLLFDPTDVTDLLDFDAKAIQDAFEVCIEVNGLRKQEIEGAAKNSESGPCAASSSSLPEPSTTNAQTNSPSA